jgi:hypothetical protein
MYIILPEYKRNRFIFFLDREIRPRKWIGSALTACPSSAENPTIYTTVHRGGRKWFRFNLSRQNTNIRGICVYALLSPDLQTNLHVEGPWNVYLFLACVSGPQKIWSLGWLGCGGGDTNEGGENTMLVYRTRWTA